MATPRLRIGQLLVDARLISAAALDEVLTEQRRDGRRLGTLLVERGLVNETQLTQILSHQLSVPWVSLLHIEFSRQLLNLVPREVADRFCLVPIYVRHVRNQGETLYVAMDDPSNEDGLAACRTHAGLPVRSMIAPPTDIRSAIRVYYGVDTPREPAVRPASEPHPAQTEEATEAPKEEAALPPSPEIPPQPATIRGNPQPLPMVQPEPEGSMVVAASAADAPITVEEPRPHAARPAVDGPEIETREIDMDLARAERLRRVLAASEAPEAPEAPETPAPPSSREVESIPRPRGRAPRMVSLTLLDGTTINLPAKRRPRAFPDTSRAATAPGDGGEGGDGAVRTVSSAAPGPDDGIQGLTARDLVLALRVVANGADASEVLGSNLRWEALFSALLSLLLKKHLIADWEFIDELKKQL